MRTVIKGTATKLHKLQASDLPLDFDLRQSYWRYVDFSGWDLSGYLAEDMDILDSDGSDCTLPESIDWLTSRRTKWAGAKIPSNLSSYNHDLMIEVAKQANVTGPSQDMANAIIESIGRGYGNSWQNNVHYVMEKLGKPDPTDIGPEGMVAAADVFKGYPDLIRRLHYHNADGKVRLEGPGDDITISTPVLVKGPKDRFYVRLDTFLISSDHDRYTLARAIEKAIEQQYGWEAVCHVDQWEPWHHIQIVAKSRVVNKFGWWKIGWPG